MSQQNTEEDLEVIDISQKKYKSDNIKRKVTESLDYIDDEDLEEIDPELNMREMIRIKNIILIPDEKAKNIALNLLKGIEQSIKNQFKKDFNIEENFNDLNKIIDDDTDSINISNNETSNNFKKYHDELYKSYNSSLKLLTDDIIFKLLKIKNHADTIKK
jgi:hypothetical protein